MIILIKYIDNLSKDTIVNMDFALTLWDFEVMFDFYFGVTL